ncbi:unnamed protein product [Trichobilharzia szidati]|nr:unnamed protein product [Trichobilharzia szidati]
MDKLGLDYLTCQLNLDMDSSSSNYQCKTLLPSYLNSDGFQASSLYMRRWRRRQNRKLEMNQLEGGQQLQQQQYPSDVSDNCERHMLTKIPVTVTTDSDTYTDVCTPTNSSSTVVSNVMSPGNYKKILIDRYLLSQSKSHSATNGNTSPFDEKMVSPPSEKKQCKVDNGNTTKNSFRADLNSMDDISVECKKSSQGVLDTTEIAKIQSIFESALHDTTKSQLTENENTNNQNFILSDNNPTNCKKQCNESNTLLPKFHSLPSEDNIQRQLSNQNSLLDNLIMQVIDRNISSRISSAGKPHPFNVLDLIHTLLIRRGSMNSDHQQRAAAATAV